MLKTRKILAFLTLAVICSAVNPCMAGDLKFCNYSWGLWPDDANVKFELDNKICDGKVFGKLTMPDASASFAVYANAVMQEKTKYKVTFSYKLKGFQMAEDCLPEMILNFRKKDGGNGSAGSEKFQWNIEKDQEDWQTFSAEISTPPETASCQVVIIGASKIKGIIWFGDFSLEKVNEVSASK